MSAESAERYERWLERYGYMYGTTAERNAAYRKYAERWDAMKQGFKR